ncbi:DUF308 domain-containing protein [Inquilinus limosus]|uniref:DUF308 domain-containing protein n=1 Tax=Inquilinus limosus TaxID=171674 RepID=UPI001E2A571B|nr:DUF308 domain-containing protein [Inquilinus limosus]
MDPYADPAGAQERWLRLYYFGRAAFSALWVAAAFTLGQHESSIAAVLLIVYPAWDALANYADAAVSGGLGRNRTQSINAIVSLITALAVAMTLQSGMNAVLEVFGVWAILSGLLQLGTALRRWTSHGAQWAMILSGGQSALAGALFIVQAQKPMPPSIGTIAGYAAVGAIYFLVSAVWLSVAMHRRAGGPARSAQAS